MIENDKPFFLLTLLANAVTVADMELCDMTEQALDDFITQTQC